MKPPIDVAILTESRYLNPVDDSEYVLNVLWEDDLLKKALERLGLKVIRVDWADPDVDWLSIKAAVFRTTWDYFDRFDEFVAWLDHVEPLLEFINPISQIRWNMDKWYLKDLEERGVKVVDTYYIKKGETRFLKDIFLNRDWEEAILKPTVAGAARHTYKFNLQNVHELEDTFAELIQHEDFMLQPFQQSVLKKGEISLMVIGGEFTHAILKKAKKGDFRVQDDFGGTVHNYEPNHLEIEFAEQAVQACDTLPAYARVDMMWDNWGDLAISELELIEPELWFRENVRAAEKLATEIKKRIDESSEFL
ncbi:MAG: hypothetical protein MI700_03180 [Balneolales bacterium]|nr:hypothetical protein [Balneolales bacterium]